MSCRQFTLKRLDALLNLGKQFPGTFWRHDVDFSLDAALKLAEFEAERGISATFYLFWCESDCPFYSPDEAETASYRLTELGHQVGQHADERRHDIDMLAFRAVSFHCPTENVLWKDLRRHENAYASRWKGSYVADSGGSFRFGDPEELFSAEKPLQVNLHPEWWLLPGWYNSVSDAEYRKFFYTDKPIFSDSRKGRPVSSGGNAVWGFDPRAWSPHCVLWVSPEDYEAVFSRGYALIDGQKAVPVPRDCDERLGFLRLLFTDGAYKTPEGREEVRDVRIQHV